MVELLRILGWYCEIVCSLGRDTSSPVEATSILDEIVSSFLFYYFLQEVSRRLPRWLCGQRLWLGRGAMACDHYASRECMLV